MASERFTIMPVENTLILSEFGMTGKKDGRPSSIAHRRLLVFRPKGYIIDLATFWLDSLIKI